MEIDMDLNIKIGLDDRALAMIQSISQRLDKVLHNQEKIMASLDDILADVSEETTSIAGISTLIAGLKQQIADALSGVTLPPAVQTKIDAVFSGVESNKQALATALADNVPPATS